MKGIYITLITIMSILAIALISILGIAIKNGGEFMSFGPVEIKESNIQKEEKLSIENIDTLEIDLVSSDIHVYETDEKEVRVVQYSNKKLGEDYLFQVHHSNNTLTIEGSRSKVHFVFFNNNQSVFEVFIPKEYRQKLSIKTVSGDIVMKDHLVLDDITLQSTSGEIQNTTVLESNIHMKTVSGDVDLENIIGDITIETTSGDVRSNEIEGNTTIHTVSGDTNIYDLLGSLNLDTTSGDVKISRLELKEDAKIKTVSGEVDLVLDNTNCEIKAKTTSGDVRLPNGSSLMGTNPEHILDIKTTSGDINIR